ncbi:MAG: hypothetical protein Q7T89_12350 [Anaerolineales bacterium]|nr:hypothetical protein [Anaerolineales bacterium]
MKYKMTTQENLLLKEGLQAAMTTFFVDGVEDFVWEAVFSYAKGIKITDLLIEKRAKLLFDVVDTKNKIGWSAKTVLTSSFVGGHEVELVIQRADILGKNNDLSKSTSPEILGKTILEHWNNKIIGDSITQKVNNKRVCILLKARNYTQYAYMEESLEIHKVNEIKWAWTDDKRKGLQGRRKSDEKIIFRWYASGGQLFEKFVLPKNLEIIEISPKQLPAKVVVDFLNNALESPEFSGRN